MRPSKVAERQPVGPSSAHIPDDTDRAARFPARCSVNQPTPSHDKADRASCWLHRLAVLLACATFPLIWVGGLVTTTDAGMAVPDWPNTYGYNLLVYPWQTWLFGPWDLMVEHGHRLLGALAGLLTITLVIAVWRFDRRPWLRRLVFGALLAVIAQGMLGGMRVLFDARRLAMVHGMVGPAFFTLTIALAALTHDRWRIVDRPLEGNRVGLNLFRLAALTTLLAYAQLALGALVRHASSSTDPYQFRVLVMLHLILAMVLVFHGLLLSARTVTSTRRRSTLRRGATGLLVLLGVQLVLGAGTWVNRFGWPVWAQSSHAAAAFTIQAGASVQTLTVTAHMATGSLILATSFWLTLETFRMWRVSRWVGVDQETMPEDPHGRTMMMVRAVLGPVWTGPKLRSARSEDRPSAPSRWSSARGGGSVSDQPVSGGAKEVRA